MPIVADRLREVNPEATAKGFASTELWEVWWQNPDGTVNENGYVDPNDAVARVDLPAIGSSHPSLFGAIVVSKRVSEVVANWSVIVAVIYRGWGLYHGGPRAVSGTFNAEPEHTVVPVYQKKTPTGQPTPVYFKSFRAWQRDRSFRVETRFLGGNQVEAIQLAIDDNAGRWYRVSVNPLRFAVLCAAKSSAYYDGLAYTRVNYVFESWAAHPGVPLGRYNCAVVVPPLSNLEGWHAVLPDDASAGPTILAVPFTELTVAGGPLPGYP